MLVSLLRKARDDERHLRQGSVLQVLQIVVLDRDRAGIVGPPLPEDEDIVRLAIGHIVEADVVDLPADPGPLEQVEDDRVVEDPITEHAVSGYPTRGARREIETIGI